MALGMRLGLAAAAFSMLAACSGDPPPPDMKDPVSVARAYVAAFNARDLSRMLPLMDQVNLDAVKLALAGGPGSDDWNAIFAPEAVAVLASENGRVEGPRYERRDAVIKVGTLPTGEVFAVELAKGKDEHWLIVENSILNPGEFETLATEPRK